MKPEALVVPVRIQVSDVDRIQMQLKRIGQQWIELGFMFERLAEMMAPDEAEVS